ncbi:reverse transcriptase domain-containing protein [Tanacetum coccineum]
MAEEDEDKTAFYVGEGVFCYKKMSFGLKNARVTYQKLVDKVFSHQIGRNLEAYVDDMVIKSTSEREMLKDIQETFERNEKEMPTDFLVEIPFEDNENKEKPKEVPDSNSKWRLYTDGASNSDGSRVRLMLIDPEGIRIAQEMEITKVSIILDSQLLVNQIKGTFAAKQTSIKDYLQKVKTAIRGFEEYTVEHVRRNQNKKADALSKLTSMTFEHLTKEVLVEVLTKRSIEEKEVLKVDMQERKTWMDPIYAYLLSELFPEDTKEARKIIIQALQYKLI